MLDASWHPKYAKVHGRSSRNAAGINPRKGVGLHRRFYPIVDVGRRGEPSREFARRALLEEQVPVVLGSAFGAATQGMVRVSLTVTGRTETPVDRLVSVLDKASTSARA
jgi:aspartate/methionine/tyrosine aminotransferase